MTVGKFAHWAFGRLVYADIELPLLVSALRGVDGDAQARIVLYQDPVSPQGDPIGGDDATSMTMYRHGEDILLTLNSTGWVAILRENAPFITLHPDARETNRSRIDDSLATRILGDRVVTTVLPYLPVAWGHLAIHGSLLTSGRGNVLLLGESGFGKSTLSQLLERDHNWRVLDDDTSMLAGAGEFALTPMGAQSRLRRDAAAQLNLNTISLPGYNGHKNAVVRNGAPADGPAEYPLACLVQLAPFGSPFGASAGELEFYPVQPERALGGLFASLFALSPDRQEAVQRQFATAASWSTPPHFRFCYDKATWAADETAARLSLGLGELLDGGMAKP